MPNNVPPHEPVYHLYEAPVPSVPPVAVSVTVPEVPQIIVLPAAAAVGAADTALIVTCAVAENAAQPPFAATV